jgi:DNA mismatch endonuclease, patch repair protein
MPKTNREYWERKIGRNVERDSDNLLKLQKMGWDALVIWECQAKDSQKLRNCLSNFLSDHNASS